MDVQTLVQLTTLKFLQMIQEKQREPEIAIKTSSIRKKVLKIITTKLLIIL